MESESLINSANSIVSWISSYTVGVSIGCGDYFPFILLFQVIVDVQGLMTFNANYRINFIFLSKKTYLGILKSIALSL